MNKDEFWTDDVKKILVFLKKNIWVIVVCIVFGYLGGVTKSEIEFELDCKYAKAVRVGASAYRCERII